LEQKLKNQTGNFDFNYEINELSYEVTQNLKANGYRLPTDWEWLFAAKANDDFEYAGSNNIDEVAWINDGSFVYETHGVGQKKANGFGLYDMTGNVQEWCWDFFARDVGRVHRGASVRASARSARLSRSDGGVNPAWKTECRGFRFSRTIR